MTENGPQLVEIGAWLQTVPWVILGLFVLPLLFLARKGIYPHLPILLLALVPAVFTFGLLVRPDWMLVVAIVDAVVLLAATVDLFTLASRNSFSVSRTVERAASIDVGASGYAAGQQSVEPESVPLDSRRSARGVSNGA